MRTDAQNGGLTPNPDLSPDQAAARSGENRRLPCTGSRGPRSHLFSQWDLLTHRRVGSMIDRLRLIWAHRTVSLDRLPRARATKTLDLEVVFDVVAESAQARMTGAYPAGYFAAMPSVQDQVGIPGLAVTGTVVERFIWDDRVRLVVQINLDGRDWTLQEVVDHLVGQGFTSAQQLP